MAAVESAATAFPSWAALGPSARRKHLQAAAARLQARAGDFAERVTAKTGATIGWGHFNVAFAASLFEEAAALTTQVAGEVIPSDHGAFAMAVRRPAGVVLGIAPWNAPVILGVRAIATPLACGNTVVLKASEVCPATHALIGEVCREAGRPAAPCSSDSSGPRAEVRGQAALPFCAPRFTRRLSSGACSGGRSRPRAVCSAAPIYGVTVDGCAR